ncbi:YibE/F family protein [Niallia sp. JL1B1071]|uniref:YibE/F family protein n=1 Tax=Niallia tiangongensis TaxID=3237105 RepID=UPI0037DC2C13
MMKTLTEMSKKMKCFFSVVLLTFIGSIIFVHNNYSFYERPIVKVVKAELLDQTEIKDHFNNKDYLFTQQIIGEIKNGEEKGKQIYLMNEFTSSKANNDEFHVGNELFVHIDSKLGENGYLKGSVHDVKRDKYLLMITWVFIFSLLFVGKKQGLFSLFSLVINAIILSIALDVYVNNSEKSLLIICSISVIIFTIISLILVSGRNEKTYAAIIATLLGTFLSLAITYLVLWLTSEKGLRYEELQFITRPYKLVFLAGLFLGSLGAVMDVAITMSSSIFGLYEKNNNISVKALITSGREIGKDIMGTMTNILLFAYISGTIPMLILYFKNTSPLGFTLSMNLSLELARALAGGIGIVLTIPIGLYITIFFVNRKRASE